MGAVKRAAAKAQVANAARSRRTGGQTTEDVAEVVSCLRRLFKAIQVYSKAILRTTGLTGPQVWALNVLASDSGLSLGQLSERLFSHPSTVSGIVDRLEERGAIARSVDSEDRRAVRINLTARGMQLLKRSPPPVQVGLSESLERMSAEQVRSLRRSLEQLVNDTAAEGTHADFFDVEGHSSAAPDTRRRRRALR